ncbi:MAG: dockerin type I domain-containing protein [Candidatus Poribacteria bacterium]|nr:dockerin type I domain-containing protein [Candidatus Poribacteria bacterium]
MKKNTSFRWLKSVLILSFTCALVVPAIAQNYYPADIGNMWVLESSDGIEKTTYSLEGPEIINGEEYILLKISTREISTGETETDQYFLSVDSDAIKIHRIILEDAIAVLTADFPTPVTFFPLQLGLGDKWQIVADAEAKLEVGLTISGKSTTNFEVVGLEEVVTPAGTFQNCAKVRLDLKLTTAFLNLDSTTYQWFAPDVGPVQYENSDGIIFSLTDLNLPTMPEAPQAEEPEMTEEKAMPEPSPEEETISQEEPEMAEEEVTSQPLPEEDITTQEETMPEPLPYDVTGDGLVNILDLTFVASRFGETDADADVTGDGIVNILDLVRIAQNLSN